MIGTISSGSPHIQVDGGASSTYVNGYSGSQGVGNLRYNTSVQKMEVYDGSIWQTLNLGHTTVRLSGSAESALTWVMAKINEEQRLKELAKDHPVIQDLLDQQAKINEQLKVAENLVKEY
jgi:hypothetical protein